MRRQQHAATARTRSSARSTRPTTRSPRRSRLPSTPIAGQAGRPAAVRRHRAADVLDQPVLRRLLRGQGRRHAQDHHAAALDEADQRVELERQQSPAARPVQVGRQPAAGPASRASSPTRPSSTRCSASTARPSGPRSRSRSPARADARAGPEPDLACQPTAGAVHQVIEGDTPPVGRASASWARPPYWRAIAELNGIDDPMRVSRRARSSSIPSVADATQGRLSRWPDPSVADPARHRDRRQRAVADSVESASRARSSSTASRCRTRSRSCSATRTGTSWARRASRSARRSRSRPPRRASDAPQAAASTREVTSIETEYGSHGTLAVVRGYDRSHRLAAGRKTQDVPERRSTRTSQPSSRGAAGLTPDVDESEGTHDHVFQAQPVRPRLPVRPRPPDRLRLPRRRRETAVQEAGRVVVRARPRARPWAPKSDELVWGDDLLDFRARDERASRRSARSRCGAGTRTRRRRSSARPQRDGDATPSCRMKPADLADKVGGQTHVVVDRGVATQQEADQIAGGPCGGRSARPPSRRRPSPRARPTSRPAPR